MASLESPNPTIIRAGSGLAISWLDPLNDYDLQARENLSTTEWIPITTEPTVVGDKYTITNEFSAASMFYRLVPSILFKAGETNKTIIDKINSDMVNEPTEHFFVHLSSPINATAAHPDGTVTILDDDLVPALAIDNISVIEGNAGTVDAVFTLNLSTRSGETVSVDFATADGTARAPGDYAATSGSLPKSATRRARC